MTVNLTDDFTRANGALGSMPGGPAYTLYNGTLTVSSNKALSSTSGSSNPIAAVELNNPDHVVTAKLNHAYGNAIYFRVKDASNWMRVRLYSDSSSYQYYVTEYQHTTYVTEYEWQEYEWYDFYIARTLQRQVSYQTSAGYYSYGSWGSWVDQGQTTTCRSTPPTTGLAPGYGAGGEEVYQQRWVTYQSSCSGNDSRYKKQERTRTETYNEPTYGTKWVNDGYSLQANESFTGSTQYVNGSGYNKLNGAQQSSNPGQRTTANGTHDTYNGTTLMSIGGALYWNTSATQSGSPDQRTGNTRQAVSSTYWDTNYEAGAPTRQAGPYTAYSYYYGRMQVERSVAGAISAVDDGYYEFNSANSRTLTVVCMSTKVFIFHAGSQLSDMVDLSTWDYSAGATKAGIGGGTSPYNMQMADIDDFTVETMTVPRVWTGSAWNAPTTRYFFTSPTTTSAVPDGPPRYRNPVVL